MKGVAEGAAVDVEEVVGWGGWGGGGGVDVEGAVGGVGDGEGGGVEGGGGHCLEYVGEGVFMYMDGEMLDG